MSLDLTISVDTPLHLVALLCTTREEMRTLLNWSEVPAVVAAHFVDGRRLPILSDALLSDNFLLLGLESRHCEVELLLESRDAAEIGEPSPRAAIAVRGAAGDPAKLALAAALAIGIAKLGNGRIIDDGQVWIADNDSTPEEFSRALRCRTPAASFEEALQQFARRMVTT